MPTEITYTTRFRKQYRKADPNIKAAFAHALELFQEKPDYPSLRNHALRKKLIGYRSIDVTDDWRAIFKEATSTKRTIITFHMIGTHQELYG